jgi:flavin reductase (NADH)/flavin reductase/chlorophenol-4-monooxygenase component 1
LVCVHQKSAAYPVISENRVLCVNLLREVQAPLSQAFAGVGALPMLERFAGGTWGVLETGAPVLKDALLSLDCRLVEAREVGAHCILIAEVIAGERAPGASPLIHQRHAYATATALPATA